VGQLVERTRALKPIIEIDSEISHVSQCELVGVTKPRS
jgi:hypothetical protein